MWSQKTRGVYLVLFIFFFIVFLTRSRAVSSGQTDSSKLSPFTIVVLPDTQHYNELDGASRTHIFDSQTHWITNHVNEHNIVLVLHLGDIVQIGTEAQFNLAQESLSYLYGIVPYIVTMGNHDRFWAEFPRPHIKNTGYHYKFFHKTFPVSFFKAMPSFGGVYKKDQIENSYHFFELGGIEYMVLAIEHRPNEGILAWANKITGKFSDKQVIVLIHEYCENNDKLVVPHGQRVWEKFVKKHRNIQFVLSGHVKGPGRLIKKGDYGNTIFQIGANYQYDGNGGDGFLRLLKFHPKNKKIMVKTFSPHLNKYKTDRENQFLIDLKTESFLNEVFEKAMKQPSRQIKNFYKNKNLQGIWNYKDGQLEGETRIYFPNGKVKMKTVFSNGLPMANSTYYKNGQLNLSRNFKNGRLEGKAIKFYNNGQMKYTVNFRNNKIYGPRKVYYKSGELKEEKFFKDNMAEGHVVKYFKSGTLKEAFNLKNGCNDGWCRGRINGQWTNYYKNGRPKAIITYVLGYEHGPAMFFFETGQLREEKNYYRNKTHGLRKFYFPTGNIKSIFNTELDETQGHAIFFYEGEGLRFVSYLKNMKRDGITYEYDHAGNLIFEWSFVNGKREGYTKKFETSGEIFILPFSNDQLNGLGKRYNSEGKLLGTVRYKNHELIDIIPLQQKAGSD